MVITGSHNHFGEEQKMPGTIKAISHRPSSLFLYSIREIFIGKRGLVKTNTLWFPLAVMATLNVHTLHHKPLMRMLQIYMPVACWSIVSIIANDLADRRADTRTDKWRWIFDVHPATAILVVLLLILAGGFTLIFSNTSSPTLIAYSLALVLGLSYSLQPFRLKEHGIMGIVGYSLACTCGFVLLPWTMLGSHYAALFILSLAVFLDKWVNLHFHQVVDFYADNRSGTHTFTVHHGIIRSRAILRIVIITACAVFFIAAGYVVVMRPNLWYFILLPLGVVTAAVVLFLQRRYSTVHSTLTRELPAYYLGLTFALFRVVPLLLFIRLAALYHELWLLVCIMALLLILESLHAFHYSYE